VLVACGARSELRTVGEFDASPAPPVDIPPDFAWYKLDETNGEVAHDSSTHHDIWLTGVSWDDGAVFDGATVCGATSFPETFRTPPVTISAWLTPAKRDDDTADAYGLTPFPPNAVSGDVPGQGGYGLGLDVWSGGAALAVETGVSTATGFHSIDGAYADGKRRFVVLVIDTASAFVYVDGKQTTKTTENIAPSVTPTPLHLGCHNEDDGYGTKRFYKGRMRDARIYKRALEPAEVAQLFSNGPVE
jgi:hypothetical protein